MLVANNIIVPDVPAHLVYEKVWYPYIYKQRNPDEYDVPDISTVDSSYLIPMEVIYRLAGVDGEATENRVESLAEDDEFANNPEKKYALAKTFDVALDGTDKTGMYMLLKDFKKIDSIQKDSYLLSSILSIMNIALKLEDNVKRMVRINGASVLVDKLFVFLSENTNEDQQILLDQVISNLEIIVVKGSKLALETDMEIDTDQKGDTENTVKNVTIILDKIVNACESMVNDCKSIQNTPDQIVAISRILPYLTNNNRTAEEKIADMIVLNVKNLFMLNEENQTGFKWDEKFRVEFY